jgi:hypothetical protein
VKKLTIPVNEAKAVEEIKKSRVVDFHARLVARMPKCWPKRNIA